MKTVWLAATLLFVVGVAVGRAPKKRVASKTIELPVCKATMAFGTPCVWFGLAELTPPAEEAAEGRPAPTAMPRPFPAAFPREFEVSASEVAAAWGRAQSFVAKYSSMKIQTATDYVIETYNPTKIGYYGYRIVKTPVGKGFTITVSCTTTAGELVAVVPGAGRMASGKIDRDEKQARLNEHLAAYYIATGDLRLP